MIEVAHIRVAIWFRRLASKCPDILQLNPEIILLLVFISYSTLSRRTYELRDKGSSMAC